MTAAWTLPDRPMSTSEISQEANKFVYSNRISLKHWARAASSLLRQGNGYVRDGNVSQAYLILLRYSTLVIQHLLNHPDAKSSEGKKALRPLTGQMQVVLDTLEFLKPQVNAAHEEWIKIAASQRDDSPPDGESSPYKKLASRDAALSWNPRAPAKLLDVGDNQDLAVNLAKQEIKRRDADRKATRQAGISEEEEQARRSAGLWDNWDVPASRHRQDDADDVRRNMDAARRTLDQTDQARRPPSSSDARAQSDYSFYDQPPAYQYPSISRTSSQQYGNGSLGGDTYNRRPGPPPARPPKLADQFSLSQSRVDSAPPRPIKEPIAPPHENLSAPVKADNTDRYTFRPAAYLEDGTPIRPIFLPIGLRDEFLRYAAPNTRRGLEMCGMLCGTCVNNALFISHLVIPKQKCTSDTCETIDEEEIMEYCESEDLLLFGWIHTHPTQTCFMSSRDLHTQSGYQVMMPESIAIVCAPTSEPSYGIFRLTNPPGLDYILNCTQSSTFHQHQLDNLYTDASNPPGHVYHSGQLDFRTKDLRALRPK